MQDLNQVFLTGRLTRDVEIKSLQNNKSVANASLAVNRKFGEKEEVVFVDLELWDKQAEILAEYAKQGKKLLIQGRLKQDSWEKDGKKYSKLLLVVEDFQFLGDKKDAQ